MDSTCNPRVAVACARAFSVAITLFLCSTAVEAAGDRIATTVTTTAPDPAKALCGTDRFSGVDVKWCTQNSTEFDHSRVLWYFHGLNEAVDGFAGSTGYATIRTAWRGVYGVKPPVLIAISFGDAWTLSDQPSTYVSNAPVLYRLVVDQVIPALEQKLVGRTPDQRWLMGKSMGSYNSSLLVERDAQLWNKVVLGCPALFTVTPYSTDAERDAYVARNVNASRSLVDFGLSVLGRDEPSIAAWTENDPLDPLMTARLAGRAPPLFIWFNLADGYGFGEGAQLLATLASAAGIPVRTASNTGNHCLLDSAIELGIAEFLR